METYTMIITSEIAGQADYWSVQPSDAVISWGRGSGWVTCHKWYSSHASSYCSVHRGGCCTWPVVNHHMGVDAMRSCVPPIV
eukprot:5907347-Amphidinium_carterae.1